MHRRHVEHDRAKAQSHFLLRQFHYRQVETEHGSKDVLVGNLDVVGVALGEKIGGCQDAWA